MRLSDCHNFHDFRRLAEKRLPGPIFNYIDGAADDEVTYRHNSESFERCDLAAIGSIMKPTMKQEGYRPKFIVAVTACAAMLGPIIPPSVILVVYGSITGVSIGALFLGGIVPGLIAGSGMMFLAWLRAIAQLILTGMLSITGDPNVALLIIMVLFFFLGTFLEPAPAMIITVPLLQPVAALFGYDPVHFGIFTVMMLVLGAITPPVGILAMVAGKMAGVSYSQAFRGLIPFVAVWLASALFVAFNPWTVTLLPGLFD